MYFALFKVQSSSFTQILSHFCLCLQVDAMKVGVKEFKKEYKNVNIDNIEVSSIIWSLCNLVRPIVILFNSLQLRKDHES